MKLHVFLHITLLLGIVAAPIKAAEQRQSNAAIADSDADIDDLLKQIELNLNMKYIGTTSSYIPKSAALRARQLDDRKYNINIYKQRLSDALALLDTPNLEPHEALEKIDQGIIPLESYLHSLRDINGSIGQQKRSEIRCLITHAIQIRTKLEVSVRVRILNIRDYCNVYDPTLQDTSLMLFEEARAIYRQFEEANIKREIAIQEAIDKAAGKETTAEWSARKAQERTKAVLANQQRKNRTQAVKVGSSIITTFAAAGIIYKLYLAPYLAKRVMKMEKSKLKTLFLKATFANKSKSAH